MSQTMPLVSPFDETDGVEPANANESVDRVSGVRPMAPLAHVNVLAVPPQPSTWYMRPFCRAAESRDPDSWLAVFWTMLFERPNPPMLPLYPVPLNAWARLRSIR